MNRGRKVVGSGLIMAMISIAPVLSEQAPGATNEPAATNAPALTNALPAAAGGVPSNAAEVVLVKIDGQPVTQADLDAEIAQIQQMMKNRGGVPQQFEALIKNVKPQILEGLIVRKLIARECERGKIAVKPEETTREIEIFTSSLPKKMNLEDFLKRNGISRETFERDVNEQIKIEKLLKISAPTDKEIKAYYDENKAVYYELPETISVRHILIGVDATDDAAKKEAKKKKAEDLRQQLINGADFAKLAEENSSCPSKARGGKLDDFSRGQMVPAFEEAAFALKTNEISKVVETEFGYHIIQALEHNAPRTVPFDDVKGQIAFRLKGKKVQEKLEALITKLKGSAKIEYQPAGEALKPAPAPEGGFPMMMPAEGKGAGKDDSSSKSKESKEPVDKKGKAK